MAKGEKLTDDRLEAIVAQEIASSQLYDSSDLADNRREAIEYMDGIMTKWPAEKGRSSVVDMTTLDTVSWILPSILRLFTASDRMAIAEPTSKKHEEWADQATIGINHAFMKDNPGYQTLYDTTWDSLLHGDGLVKHYWDATPKTEVSFHSGLTDMALQDLLTPTDSGVDEDGNPMEEVELLSDELVEYTLEPGDEAYGYTDPAQPSPPATGPEGAAASPPGMPAAPQGGPPQGMPPEMAQMMGEMPQGAPAPPQGPGMAPPSPMDIPPGMESGVPGMETTQMPPMGSETAGGQPLGGPPMGPEQMPVPPTTAMLHDVKIKRTCRYGKIAINVVAPEDFVISADATSLRRARLIGDKQQKTRAELIEMGFDYDKVMGLTPTQQDDSTETSRRDSASERAGDQPHDNEMMEQVTLYELYLQIDADGDGETETVQVFFSGFGNVGTLLEWEVWEDEPVYSNVPCYPVPHRWNANGIFTRTRDVQEIKTVLTRQALDNMYGSNNPQRFATGRIINPDELINPSFGGTVMGDIGATLTTLEVPFFAEHALKGIEYFNQVMERRTGVSRTTMALDPEALQNQTATASQLAHDSAYSQIELIARNQAEIGWSAVFKAILRLLIKHQRRKQTIRMTGKKWADVDPRHWDADMDVTINTGLGTGSRDRDIAVLSAVQSNQVAMTAILREAQMPGRALEMVPMILDTLRKSGEAAGIKTIDEFYPDVSEQDLADAAKAIQAKQSQPSPEQQLLQAQMQGQAQIEQVKAQSQMQAKQAELQAEGAAKAQEMDLKANIEQSKSQAQVIREQAQLEADIRTKQMDLENELTKLREQQQADAAKQLQQQEFDAIEKQKDRDLQLELAHMKDMASQRQAADKMRFDGEQAKMQGQHKTNEMLIKAGKNPVGNGVDAAELLKVLSAPKRIVRDPTTGRATHVETVVN